MSVGRSRGVGPGLRLVLVGLALALGSAGCGYADSTDSADESGGAMVGGIKGDPVDEVVSQLRVVPIARKAIERKLGDKEITDVVCTSTLMYVSEGAVTHCTASINDQASGWTLTFLDAAGEHELTRKSGEPWEFAAP